MKRLPFFTPSQRRALLVIIWVLLIGVIVLSVRSWMRNETPTKKMGETKDARSNYPAKQYTYAVEEEPFETFPFDPNTADSTTLLRLGLSPWQVQSIYRYRAKHGRYHKPEDFKRVPGMTNEQWERLGPQVRIDKKYQYIAPSTNPSTKDDWEKGDLKQAEIKGNNLHIEDINTGSLPIEDDVWKGSVKLSSGQTVDINTADTTLLKMIPGIGSKRAARIVAYRKSLGGFVAIEQAMEAIEMPDTVLKYMTVSAQPVTKINVNNLSVQQLMKHPYLNFYQSKAIFEYRRNTGNLHSIEELSRLEAFKPTDIDRLRPYITFE